MKELFGAAGVAMVLEYLAIDPKYFVQGLGLDGFRKRHLSVHVDHGTIVVTVAMLAFPRSYLSAATLHTPPWWCWF